MLIRNHEKRSGPTDHPQEKPINPGHLSRTAMYFIQKTHYPSFTSHEIFFRMKGFGQKYQVHHFQGTALHMSLQNLLRATVSKILTEYIPSQSAALISIRGKTGEGFSIS